MSEKLLELAPVVPVVVLHDAATAVPLARALVDGGLPVIEVTLRTPAALEAVRRIAAEVPDAVVGTGFPYDRGTSEENNLREASHIIPKVRGIRRCGAAALDVCLVADGTYDGYWEQKVSPWDVCAGLAIALAAGAKVSDYEGNDADARTSRLVVTNGPLHPALLGAVQRARG